MKMTEILESHQLVYYKSIDQFNLKIYIHKLYFDNCSILNMGIKNEFFSRNYKKR